MKTGYVLCINNEGHEASLEVRKVYRTAPARPGDYGRGMKRVIDESEEDYLYPGKYFIEFPADLKVARGLGATYRTAARQKVSA